MSLCYPHSSQFDIFEDPFFHQGLDPLFGMALLPNDFYSNRIVPRSGFHHHLPTGYRRPWAVARQAMHEMGMDKKEHLFGLDGFQACVDVHHFEPSEITVKTEDNTVIIEGKHEERDDNQGSIQRHFIRKYTLPKDYDPKTVTSNLSSDGVLIVKAPLPASIEAGQRHVPIQHTNVPIHLSIKDNKKKDCAHKECPKKECIKKGDNGPTK